MASTEIVSPRPRTRRGSIIPVDYFFTLLLAAAVGPAFFASGLPFRLDLGAFAGAYWGGTAVRSVFFAVGLSVLAFSPNRILLPMLRRYWRQKARFLVVAVLALWLFGLFGFWLGLTILVDALALAELLDRRKLQFGTSVLDIVYPAAYLFVGVLLVYLLNHAIAGIKFAGSYDPAFEKADQVLFHVSVSRLSHAIALYFPRSCLFVLEMVYFSLFAQIGAAIILTALLGGRRYATRYVGTLIIAYAIALAFFLLWPSIGPFSIYAKAERSYLLSFSTYVTQQGIVSKAYLLHARHLIPEVKTVNLSDYYIGFPSMHVALPAVALWFLRKWKRVALLLVWFDALLLISIVALQWHYLVDLLGGVLAAMLAIGVNRTANETPEPSLPDEHQIALAGSSA
jgi:hypothetical protein